MGSVESKKSPIEVVNVTARTVSCDGGNGPLGHPRVYLTMDKTDQVDCPYCGKRFILSSN